MVCATEKKKLADAEKALKNYQAYLTEQFALAGPRRNIKDLLQRLGKAHDTVSQAKLAYAICELKFMLFISKKV